jgi:hypothetical protein
VVEHLGEGLELGLHQEARRLQRQVTPTIELWARCAVPNASLT